jgi:CRISPR/Cas system-associated endonuclease Cas1
MQNYAVGIAAARMTRVVIVRGLDAGFGFLHDGRKPGRLSLVWDCIEPLRPGLVKAVFEFAAGKVFHKVDTIDEEIKLRDKLLLILSENSIASDWVEDEVNKAFAEERGQEPACLISSPY